MEHIDIRHKLSDYLDGSVSAQEKALIEEHLKTCTECDQALLELQKTIELVKNIEEVQPPDWMAQKIMATVRAEAAEKKSFLQRLFFPLSIKLPIQAVAVVFLTITVVYMYRGVQPTAPFSEAPLIATGKSAEQGSSPTSAVNRESDIAASPATPSKKLKAPGSNTSDETAVNGPAELRALQDRPASAAPAPSKQADRPALEKREILMEKQQAAPSSLDAADASKQFSPAAGAPQRAKARNEYAASSLEKKSVPAGEPASGLVKDVVERHANGRPRLVITYAMIDSQMRKRAEERFNADGEREGIQKEYYPSGGIKTEAQYEKNRPVWYREYGPDGVKKTGASDYDWFWLRN